MFTGIIEATGKVKSLEKKDSNLKIWLICPFTPELKVDQSVSHNGVCLTVAGFNGDGYEVIAIDETLKRSNLRFLKPGDAVNLERCMKIGDRLDGHIVQGHVDTTAKVSRMENSDGSWIFHFEYADEKYITVEKGSICVNGVSLTVVESGEKYFSVAIIPYTFENTGFRFLKKGDVVNLEFDIIGKYIERLMKK
jgi:riboflavin synthase